MFINKGVMFFLFISTLTFPQTKKQGDTLFVYEKVFVYKKISKKVVTIGFDSIKKREMTDIKPFKMKIIADSLSWKMAVKSKKESLKNKNYYVVDNYGISIQSLFSQQPEIKNYGLGIGIFVTKNLYKNQLFLKAEFSFSEVFGTIDVSALEGYYITPGAVVFYRPEKAITQQITIPITFSWKYRKINPEIGIAYIRKQTQFDFLVYKNNTDLITSLKESYELTSSYLDFVYGIEYQITKKVALFLKSKQTVLKLSSNSAAGNLKSIEELHFFPNQVTFGVNYKFKT